MKYLKFYEECLKTGTLPGGEPRANGLCDELDNQALELIQPTNEDVVELEKNSLCTAYWGSGLPNGTDYDVLGAAFTPLRQNLVLLLAAMNDEL